MAQDSFQDKTEEPTPRRLEKAREEGNVAKSPEFNSVFILFFGLLTLYFFSGTFLDRLIVVFKTLYQQSGSIIVNTSTVGSLFGFGIRFLITLVTPLVLVLMVVGLGVNLAQVGFLFTTKPLVPNLNKLNPISGFKRFFSLRSLVELAKGILKILVVGVIAYWFIVSQKEKFLLLVNENVGGILSFIASSVFQLALYISAALLVLAFLDFLYQKKQYKQDLKMSKQEVKEERKESEGDPLIKSTIRSLQRERARRRMMDEAADADVVVTNPTKLAVALKYDPNSMSAPIVVAKGARLLAEKIKDIARNHDIPIYENKPLAQSLYKSCDIGKQIPFELFHAVAEVFAFVYHLKQKEERGS